MARSYVWWPKVDSAIEETVRSCQQCFKTRTAPPVAPLHPWVWPSNPWQRIHIDFATYEGNQYLIMVDAHSKWPEVVGPMRTTNAEPTTNAMRCIFARYGLPEQVSWVQRFPNAKWHTTSYSVSLPSIVELSSGTISEDLQNLYEGIKHSNQPATVDTELCINLPQVTSHTPPSPTPPLSTTSPITSTGN